MKFVEASQREDDGSRYARHCTVSGERSIVCFALLIALGRRACLAAALDTPFSRGTEADAQASSMAGALAAKRQHDRAGAGGVDPADPMVG